jgi:hypothetical protein
MRTGDITEVWLVKDEQTGFFDVFSDENDARRIAEIGFYDGAVQRLPLLTPEAAAVVEAAEALFDVIEPPRTDNYREYRNASNALAAAVRTLHAAQRNCS